MTNLLTLTNIRLKDYYNIAKPGIIYGNLVSLTGGFFYGSGGKPNLFLYLAAAFGTALVMAAACVLNNIIDKDIDAKMERTKKRAIAAGTISPKAALIYSLFLVTTGSGILIFFTNIKTAAVGAVGLFFYVVVYGYIKRRSVHGTLIGTISGSTPLVAGYTAATNRLGKTALLLFIILALWQMAHFYAIAIYRLKEYRAANLPMMPVIRGVEYTKRLIIFYIIAFIAAALILGFSAGFIYITVILTAGLLWLKKALAGYNTINSNAWAVNIFKFSLVVLVAFNVALGISPWLL